MVIDITRPDMKDESVTTPDIVMVTAIGSVTSLAATEIAIENVNRGIETGTGNVNDMLAGVGEASTRSIPRDDHVMMRTVVENTEAHRVMTT